MSCLRRCHDSGASAAQRTLTTSCPTPLGARYNGRHGYFNLNGATVLCLDVFVNGSKLCTAGIGEPGVLHAPIIWVLRHGQFDYSGTPGTDDEAISLTVDGDSYPRQEALSWPNTNLKVGDEVTIRVVDLDSADEPTRVKMTAELIR
jgi:hypothetical protein